METAPRMKTQFALFSNVYIRNSVVADFHRQYLVTSGQLYDVPFDPLVVHSEF